MATNVPSSWRIASIAPDDALILPQRANPAGWNFREPQGEGQEEDRAEAAERLRSLVSKIILTPDNGRLTIDVQGDLAGILAIAHADRPTGADTTVSQTTTAGRRQFSFPKNKGRLGEAADVAELAQQVKLVAGERNQLYLLLCAAG